MGLKQRKHYSLASALDQARVLVTTHPNESRAEALYADLLELNLEQRQLDWKEHSRELKEEVFDRINQSLIPTGHDGWPVFADDWHERAKLRDSHLLLLS